MSKHYQLWALSLAAFKMLTLTKILYIFRVLPIKVPLTFFKNFIWVKGKTQCAHSILETHRKAGGMGLPIFTTTEWPLCWTK